MTLLYVGLIAWGLISYAVERCIHADASTTSTKRKPL